MDKTKVCIVGAGNIGMVSLGVIGLTGKYDVVLFTNRDLKPEEYMLRDVENGTEHQGIQFSVESDPVAAFTGAKYILCTYPAFLRHGFIKEYGKYIEAGSRIGFIPGYGGAEFAAKELVDKGVIVFGLQRVPFVSRQEGRKVANLLSRKDRLYLASIPKRFAGEICRDLEDMLGIPVQEIPEYLSVTLAPSNPLLHLTGLYGVFKDYQPGDSYDRQLMFYTEWNDETSRMLFAYDAELQEICSRIPIDLSDVVPLPVYYESPTPEQMTRKLKSIKAFEVVQVPLVQREDGAYYPDFGSRMFIEDFPYGIAIIKYFALLTGVETPTIDEILRFYHEKTGILYFNEDGTFGPNAAETGIPGLFGLDSLDKVVAFYRQ